MDERLRQNISETCGSEFWEPVTGVLWQNGTPWQIWKYENDVEFGGKTYRCVILEKYYIDPDDASAIDHSEDILAEAWEI